MVGPLTPETMSQCDRVLCSTSGRDWRVLNLFKGRESRESFDGEQYYGISSMKLPRTFTAEKQGEYTFGPAFIKGTFVSGGRET